MASARESGLTAASAGRVLVVLVPYPPEETMLDWSQLLLPALLSAIAVFIVSSVIHVALKYHNSDFKKLSNEDEVRAAIRKGAPGPGQYMVPHCSEGGKKDPAVMQKFVEGPVGLVVL